MNSIFSYETEIGLIWIAENGVGITHLTLNDKIPLGGKEVRETKLIKTAASELKEYFSGERKIFEVKLLPEGTEFQKRVWGELQKIPYGEKRSYKQVAEAIGQPNAARAVGMANNKNPIFIMIPCHRVVGAKGDLVGFGYGLNIKEKLLSLENRCSL